MTVGIRWISLGVGAVCIMFAAGCATPPVADVTDADRDLPAPPRVDVPVPAREDQADVEVAEEPIRIEEPDAAALLDHAGRDATVSASSTQRLHEGEGPVEALLDGDLSTRWASDYAEPQSIVVNLPEPRALASVRLHWETASASVYTVSVSPDGETWTPVTTEERDEAGPRVDNLSLDGSEILALRFELQQRTKPEWGFSLYQIELLAP